MADIEERLKSHSSAFEGLLSLIPGDKYFPSDNSNQWTKRKQSKEEHKRAKKAKLDPDSATTAAEMREKKRHRSVASDDNESGEGDDDEDAVAEDIPVKEQQPVTKKSMKAKATPTQKKKAELSEAIKTPTQQKKGKGRTSDEAVAPPSEVLSIVPATEAAADNDEEMVDANDEETIQVNGFADIETPVPATPALKRLKPQLDPAQRAEQRARLAARIEALRAKRKADNADGTSARTRQDLLEARRNKDLQRKERKKQLRLAAKMAGEETAETLPTGVEPATPATVKKPASTVVKDFSFGVVTFDDGRKLDAKLQDFQKEKKRKGPTDLLGQIKHNEAKKRRLENMSEEKKAVIEEKDKWSKALKQATGEKVKDDEKLLKKALKRQEAQKRKSATDWNERLSGQAKAQQLRQKKREENIQARKDQKKAHKMGKKGVIMKKGGKPIGKKGPKKVSRPGFEGGFKAGKGGKGKK